MIEVEPSNVGYGLAASALRVEYEPAWAWKPSSKILAPDSAIFAYWSSELPATVAPWLPAHGSPRDGRDPAASATMPDHTRPGSIDISCESTGLDESGNGPLEIPAVRAPSRDDALAPVRSRQRPMALFAGLIGCALIATVGWQFAEIAGVCRPSDRHGREIASRLAADTVARRIVIVESNGDADAKNPLSSATGAAQFLDGTWLDMIRAYRPDLSGQHETEILALRHDPKLSREMVARFAEQNAALLVSRCLPVTPGTLYLAHFAGSAGAAAVLVAPEHADAADIMAKADSTGRTTRKMIVTANPFLEDFTTADLMSWADRKMKSVGGDRLSQM